MVQEIEKFDPSTLMQGVKDRIKATFMSLIPDDKWGEMVDAEIKKFFELKDGLNEYHSRNSKTSHFTDVVFQVLTDECKKRCTEILNHPDFVTNWSGNKETVSETLKKRLVDNMPEIMASMMENMMANAIQQLKNRGY
jgi:hypothetical protein